MWLTICVGLLVALVSVLGTLVYIRNSSLRLNRAFALVTYILALWITANYVGANFKQYAFSYFFIHADFFFGALAAFSFWHLGLALLQSVSSKHRFAKAQRRLQLAAGGIVLATMLFTFSPIFAEVVRRPQGVVVNYGPAFIIYAVLLSFFLILGSLSIVAAFRQAKGSQRQQLSTITFGLILAALLVGATNLILPQLTDAKNINLIAGNVSYLGIVAFVAATYYSIAYHKLFDIRLVVARTVGYIVSITALATIYGLVVFGTASYVFGLNLSLTAQIFLSIATGLAGLIFQRPIKMFDKFTNHIFYQDAYDAQELFDDLNRILVSSLDLNYLLKHGSELLAEKLKAEYVLIGLKGDEDGHFRIAGTTKKEFKIVDIEKARRLTPKYHQSVIVADYLDDKRLELRKLMSANDISVLVRLVSDVHKGDEGLGYIVLGAKKSGNPYDNQDIRVLDTVANELIIAIQNALHFEEIQQFNATLQSRITEATRKLRSTNAKLEALDETKDDFISMASHQLRTPLTSVKGYLSMVIEGDAGTVNDTQRKMLNQAFISSQRMVYLIADLLNVSRLKTGKFIIDWAPVDLSKVIQEEISQLVETAESRGITLTYKKPADFPVLNMDETKTRQVIMNFVDNAIYYTPAGGSIDVQLIDKNASIELRVVDTGIGVPKAEQHHLFTKFYRARNAQKARPDGTGLGLFMAKKVIVAQGGALIFESKEGQGSTFGFSFSKARLNPANSQMGAPAVADSAEHKPKA